MRPRLPRPLRSNDAALFLESFLVAAVVSVLGIRWFLALTGFPAVGAAGLHIAHMLWGGALMLVALLLLLLYLDRPVQHVAAVVAGLGFGTFIDEIGKFVTADNDYFYRPAAALIYIVLVVVFLVGRTLVGRRTLTEREALANALDLLEVRLGMQLEGADRARIANLLDRAGNSSDLVPALRHHLGEMGEVPDVEAWWETVPRWFAARYRRVSGDARFAHALTIAVIAYAVAAVITSLLVVLAARRTDAPLAGAALGQIASTFAGAALIGVGILALPASRAEAYRWFLRGILVWLLVTQVFAFYESQLAGVGGLAVDLAAYAMLRYALSRETVGGGAGDEAGQSAGPASASGIEAGEGPAGAPHA